MSIAIMQPYFFPYIGYFQLITATDKFIFYDDVNFIKNGWINRNRILINGNPSYFTVQLKDASPNRLINEVHFTDKRKKLKRTIEINYKKAPQFDRVWPLIEEILDYDTDLISEQAIYSVKQTSIYMGIDTIFEKSSEKYPHTKGFQRGDRLTAICAENNSNKYVNPIGGQALYTKEFFENSGITLNFIKTDLQEYHQKSEAFVPGLSIIDVIMWNDLETIKRMLMNYQLV